ncbi:MAG TPA: ATP-binding cassette domain-containing protein [Methanomicrobia archaeon]|nr:ATP-binding cassette domain-containing protein [Methanomicrobia archaeon]
MDAIEVTDLSKRYNGLTAVDRVTFTVQSGEVFGFLGPNGAGKTTTVRMLTGVIKPDAGEARVLGHDLQKDTAKAKAVQSVVPETANAYVDLTAWGNLMLIASLYGIPRHDAAQRAATLLSEFELYERRASKAKSFSKGMKQRLMLAMALVSDPAVLFLDEPTSGLDVQSARSIRQKILKLRDEGRTVFLTSHNMQEVSLLCDRVGIINHGKLVALESPEMLRRRLGGTVAVECSFDRPLSSPLPGAERVGDAYRMYTTDPHEVISAIVDFATRNGLKLLSVNVQTPSLEDVFVKLTGGASE